jgi:hypothetical protein
MECTAMNFAGALKMCFWTNCADKRNKRCTWHFTGENIFAVPIYGKK